MQLLLVTTVKHRHTHGEGMSHVSRYLASAGKCRPLLAIGGLLGVPVRMTLLPDRLFNSRIMNG